MTPADWTDTVAIPPRPLPERIEDAIVYLSDVLKVPVYRRWTPATLFAEYGTMEVARRAQPEVVTLLLRGGAVVQYWQAGQVIVDSADRAPRAEVVVERLLRTLRVRFRPAVGTKSGDVSRPAASGKRNADRSNSLDDEPWLARTGHLVNQDVSSNTLGVFDDLAAVKLFLRDRAAASHHTRRGYAGDIRRLIRFCERREIPGPISGLSREQLVAYREFLSQSIAQTPGQPRSLSERSQQRALAVVRSVTSYFWKTGYLSANPGAGIGDTAAARTQFTPARVLPARAVRAIDEWLLARLGPRTKLTDCRQAAIVAIFRFTGIRVAELAWKDGFPRIVPEDEGPTLIVRGKGGRVRTIPLPDACMQFIRQYENACGLPASGSPGDALPLIPGQRGMGLGASGLYRQVRVAFREAAASLPADEPVARLALLRASPHWLRHLVGRKLVVEDNVPLTIAQAVLGHASVVTTATYARASTTKIREIMQHSFRLDADGDTPATGTETNQQIGR